MRRWRDLHPEIWSTYDERRSGHLGGAGDKRQATQRRADHRDFEAIDLSADQEFGRWKNPS